MHPRSHVWLCFVYHVLEIVSRFIPLALLALAIRGWFFFVLPDLWVNRCLLVLAAAWKSGNLGERDALRKALNDYRFRVRLVAMPFLDSVMDGTVAFGSGLVLTLVEFIVFLATYYSRRDDDLPPRVRSFLTVVAIGCMVGKLWLAVVAIFPLKKDRDGSEGRGSAVAVAGTGGRVG